jgi:hypothetical protein
MKKTTVVLFLLLNYVMNSFCHAQAEVNTDQELSSTSNRDSFFANISAHCGKAYAGKVTIDTSNNPNFANKPLIMHIRKCSTTQLQIPFHVGDDSSRTWLISKVQGGLSLKHDHRHKDGSEDKLTMYGGHSNDQGSENRQSFPADQYSKQLFIDNNIPQSTGNTWQVFIYADKYSYRLVRKGMEFQVDFDLTQPVELPSPPWGADQ